jgi:hypothetical protein
VETVKKMKKIILSILLTLTISIALSCSVFAEPNRPLYTKENRLPDKDKTEIGTLASYAEYDEGTSTVLGNYLRHEGTVTPYFRYGLLENMSVYSKIPFKFIDSDLNGTENGLSDISLGLEFLVYEYIFSYPYVLPYIEVTFPTGDDDNGLGTGEFEYMIGTSIGDTMYNVYHFILDGRFEYQQFSNNETESLFSGGLTAIWDVSDAFSILAEARITQEPENSDEGIPGYFNAGMCYEAANNLSIYWYGGTTMNTDENGYGMVKIAYSF